MLSTKRFAVLSGILVALAGLLGACGTGNNMVPAVQLPGGTGQCAYGTSYYPGGGYYGGNPYGGNPYGGNPYGGGYPYYGGGAAGCAVGYIYNGGQCICTSSYYNNGSCPVGYIMYAGRCTYSSGGYNGGYCPPGQYYQPGYGCHY